MEQPNLQKLITVFLALAVLATSLTLILSNNPSQQLTNRGRQENSGQTSQTGNNRNVFVENLGGNAGGNHTNVSTGDSTNLTKLITKDLADQIITNNPDGPQLSQTGGYILNAPSDALVASMTSKLLAGQKIKIDEHVSDGDIKIISVASSSPEDAVNYFKSLSDILNEISSDQKLNELIGKPVNGPELNNIARATFQNGYRKLLALKVPEPLKEVHLGFLKILADQKKIFEIIGDYRSDPVKSFAAVRASGDVTLRDLKDFSAAITQTGESQPRIYVLFQNLRFLSFFQKLIGINTAYAESGSLFGSACQAIQNLTQPIKDAIKGVLNQITAGLQALLTKIFGNIFGNVVGSVTGQLQAPTSVPVNVVAETAASAQSRTSNLQNIVAQNECEWLYQVVLQSVKNVLLAELQNELVAWIQGGGKPLFITNWKAFLGKVGDIALGNVIFDIAPFLCTGIGPLILLTLQPVPHINIPIKCTLTQVINNVQAFYDSFSNGGWIAYAYTLEPQNNIFGGVIQANQIVSSQISKETASANAEAKANSGFLPPKVCVKYNTEYGPFGEPPGTVCQEWKNVTPGAAVAHALFAGENWIPQEIISAQQFEQLAAAVVNALINRLIREAGGLLGAR